LASASNDLTVKVWDATSGQETLTLRGHTDWVVGVAFSPDGNRLASASDDGTVKIWEATTDWQTLTLRGHTGEVTSVAFSPSGKRLASASNDLTVKVWDATSGQETITLKGHTGAIWSVAFSPDGRRLASGSVDHTVRMWDATSGQETLTLRGHTGGVASVAFSPDGRRLASASADQTVKLWDATSGQETLTLKGHRDQVFSVAFSPDGKRLASASHDATVKVWDTTSGQETMTLRTHTGHFPCVVFSPEGKRLAAACWDGTVKLWDARTPTPELRAELAALGLVQFLADGTRDKQSILDTIRGDLTISEQVRRRALELTRLYWEIQVSQKPSRLVERLLGEGMLKEEVIEAIAADESLSEPVRQRATELARASRENAEALSNASWTVVRQPDQSAEQYRRALRQAEAASRLEPDDGDYRNTLGVALYRVGQYAEAVNTLTRSDEINSKENGESQPEDIAFLALAQHRLGRTDAARKLLDRLRQLLQQDRWKNDADSQAFLREAETLIAVPRQSPSTGEQPESNQTTARWKIPVLVLRYFPVTDDKRTIDIKVTSNVSSPLEEIRKKCDRVTAELIEALQQGSGFRAYKNPQAPPSLQSVIVDTKDYLEPVPRNPKKKDKADYVQILERAKVREYVEQKGVKEVWIWGYHSKDLSPWESNMASPHGDISNSDRDPSDLPVLSKTYTVYHYNYERDTAEAAENHMHQIEAVMRHHGGELWQRFEGKPGAWRCGNAHFPPNGRRDYDWANKEFVLSDIEDWKPEGFGKQEKLNSDKWGGSSLKWFIYWMQSIPGADNGLTYQGRTLSNWWELIGDYDQAAMRKSKLSE
jgi:tetratricopeptide (TPR) repeat protein